MKRLILLAGILLLSCGGDKGAGSGETIKRFSPRAEGKKIYCGWGYANDYCLSKQYDHVERYDCYVVAEPKGAAEYIDWCECSR